MPLRKIARIVGAAGRDADIARRTSTSPEFRRAVMKDRRGALSAYATVKHALRDRERFAAAKGGPKASAKDSGGPKANGKDRKDEQKRTSRKGRAS